MATKTMAAIAAGLMLSGCGGSGGVGEAAAASSGVVIVPATATSDPAPAPTPTPTPVATPTATPSQVATLPAPALLADVSLVIPDTVVPTNATIANVHVKLSQPVDRQLAFDYLTSNGTAVEGRQFTRTQGTLNFRPGESDKVVSIPTSGLTAGQTFNLTVSWTKNTPAVAGSNGKILVDTTGTAVAASAATAAPTYTLLPAAGTTGRQQVFTSDFHGAMNPTGGVGVWRTRFDWGRWQSGNNEAAPYTDATTDPGTNPHPIIDGYRTLRAEKVPTTDGTHSFAYSASMVSTQGWYSFQYGYIQLRAKVNPENGVTPAFWLLPATGEWPPEIDIFEFFNGSALASTVHFKTDPKGTSEGMAPVSRRTASGTPMRWTGLRTGSSRWSTDRKSIVAETRSTSRCTSSSTQRSDCCRAARRALTARGITT